MSEPITKPRDLNTEMAAERTMLAWIRTGLALMGFGFVVAKFGLFLRRLEQLQLPQVQLPERGTAYSVWIGLSLVLVGVAVNVLSALRYRRLLITLRTGEASQAPEPRLAFYVALVMAAVGVGIALYLAKLRM
ncbi:MAG: DUF202 domain-containing protein [Deltaproteobacteria bacterium]|nr:DUF202 domain-containing protein [Deltaproteobacteria bacterium]